MKTKLSGAKKYIKSFIIGTDRVRRILDESTLGIVNIVKKTKQKKGKRLKDIELQRWLSEISNDTRKLANQSTVFDAIVTSTRDKLQCLYENLMSNNFPKTAVLKKV